MGLKGELKKKKRQRGEPGGTVDKRNEKDEKRRGEEGMRRERRKEMGSGSA